MCGFNGLGVGFSGVWKLGKVAWQESNGSMDQEVWTGVIKCVCANSCANTFSTSIFTFEASNARWFPILSVSSLICIDCPRAVLPLAV